MLLPMLFALQCYSNSGDIRNIRNWNHLLDVMVIRIGIGPHRLTEEVFLQNIVSDPIF